MGNYNKLLHKQILIRKDTKTRMDDYKKIHGLSSYNAVINFLMDECPAIRIQQAAVDPIRQT